MGRSARGQYIYMLGIYIMPSSFHDQHPLRPPDTIFSDLLAESLIGGQSSTWSWQGGQKGLRPMWAEDTCVCHHVPFVVSARLCATWILAEPGWWAGSDRESSSQDLRLKT